MIKSPNVSTQSGVMVSFLVQETLDAKYNLIFR